MQCQFYKHTHVSGQRWK